MCSKKSRAKSKVWSRLAIRVNPGITQITPLFYKSQIIPIESSPNDFDNSGHLGTKFKVLQTFVQDFFLKIQQKNRPVYCWAVNKWRQRLRAWPWDFHNFVAAHTEPQEAAIPVFIGMLVFVAAAVSYRSRHRRLINAIFCVKGMDFQNNFFFLKTSVLKKSYYEKC